MKLEVFDYEQKIKEEKTKCAKDDFDLLLSHGNIAFYKGCEVTQIFLYDKRTKETKNYFCLFVFDEMDQVDNAPTELLKTPIKLDKNFIAGIQQKRISLPDAKNAFDEIPKGTMHYDDNCLVSEHLTLLPKTYVPSLSLNKTVMLNNVLKPNYWGDNYIIEFFDETKEMLSSHKDAGNIFNLINEKVKSLSTVKIDLTKVYDRIGNILFQFPITILKSEVTSREDSVNICIKTEYHPLVTNAKNLHIKMISKLDNVITGFNSYNSNALSTNQVLKVGDDNNLQTLISDDTSKLLLHNSEVNFLKGFHFGGKIGIQYSEPRTIILRNGSKKEIELFTADCFGSNIHDNDNKNYVERISARNRNNEILQQSGDYKVFKENQADKAFSFLRDKIIRHSGDIKEICLWDPYLTAYDIMETLYFEDTGLPLKCITSYQKSKNLSDDDNQKSFEQFRKEQKDLFLKNSNNLRVNLKFLAQQDMYGWKFHDRFLIFVPKDRTNLPEAYSLGTSINTIGKNHHIIQKVPNSREILNNFEELWKLLDNDECLVAEFPEKGAKQ